MNYFALTEPDLKRLLTRRSLIAALFGIALGAVAVWAYEQPIVDYRMEVSCAFPKQNGEATFVAVMNGKTVCWRFE